MHAASSPRSDGHHRQHRSCCHGCSPRPFTTPDLSRSLLQRTGTRSWRARFIRMRSGLVADIALLLALPRARLHTRHRCACVLCLGSASSTCCGLAVLLVVHSASSPPSRASTLCSALSALTSTSRAPLARRRRLSVCRCHSARGRPVDRGTVLLELAVFCVYRLERAAARAARRPCASRTRGGSAASGLRGVPSFVRSPSSQWHRGPRSPSSARRIAVRQAIVPPTVHGPPPRGAHFRWHRPGESAQLATQFFVAVFKLRAPASRPARSRVYVVGFAALFVAPTPCRRGDAAVVSAR